MNLEETVELLAALKDAGATHFKSKDFEVYLGVPAPAPVRKALAPQKDQAVYREGMQQPDLPGIGNPEDTKKAEDLIRTLRNPERLIDSIFPDGAGG